MNKLLKTLSLFAAMAFFATACIPPVVEVAQAAPAEVSYQDMLGKSVRDRDVADFIASNNCVQTVRLRLCQPAGIVLWLDSDQIVDSVYLYVSNPGEFSTYKGELPLGLAASDTMTEVEQKLGQPELDYAPQGGWEPALPDEGYSPGHIHYWAIYKRLGVTVIYNTLAANDKNATIHVILVTT